MIFNIFCFSVLLILSLESFIIFFDLVPTISKRNFITLMIVDLLILSLTSFFINYSEIFISVILCINLLLIFKIYKLKIIGTYLFVYISLSQITLDTFFLFYYIFYHLNVNIDYIYIEYINYVFVLIILSLYCYFCNRHNKQFFKKIKIHRVKYFIIIQFIILLLNTFFVGVFYNYNNNNIETELNYYLFSSLFSIVIIFIGLIIYQIVISNLKLKELVILNNRYITQQKIYYDSLLSRYNNIRKLQHDYKQHLTIIKSLISSGKIDRAMSYMDTVLDKAEFALHDFLCDNFIVNSILLEYKPYIEDNNISLTIKGKFPSDIKINDYDLCIIFSNLLQNAIEACMLIEKDRKIEIIFNSYGLYLNIIVKNTFTGISNNLNTIKKDSINHGIGLKNIQECVKDNNGNIEISHQSTIFCVDVLLQGETIDI